MGLELPNEEKFARIIKKGPYRFIGPIRNEDKKMGVSHFFIGPEDARAIQNL
jgi:hypothetical protein